MDLYCVGGSEVKRQDGTWKGEEAERQGEKRKVEETLQKCRLAGAERAGGSVRWRRQFRRRRMLWNHWFWWRVRDDDRAKLWLQGRCASLLGGGGTGDFQ